MTCFRPRITCTIWEINTDYWMGWFIQMNSWIKLMKSKLYGKRLMFAYLSQDYYPWREPRLEGAIRTGVDGVNVSVGVSSHMSNCVQATAYVSRCQKAMTKRSMSHPRLRRLLCRDSWIPLRQFVRTEGLENPFQNDWQPFKTSGGLWNVRKCSPQIDSQLRIRLNLNVSSEEKMLCFDWSVNLKMVKTS